MQTYKELIDSLGPCEISRRLPLPFAVHPSMQEDLILIEWMVMKYNLQVHQRRIGSKVTTGIRRDNQTFVFCPVYQECVNILPVVLQATHTFCFAIIQLALCSSPSSLGLYFDCQISRAISTAVLIQSCGQLCCLKYSVLKRGCINRYQQLDHRVSGKEEK